MVTIQDIGDLINLLKRSDNFEKIYMEIIKTLFLFHQRSELPQKQVILLSIHEFEEAQKKRSLTYPILIKILEDLYYNIDTINHRQAA